MLIGSQHTTVCFPIANTLDPANYWDRLLDTAGRRTLKEGKSPGKRLVVTGPDTTGYNMDNSGEEEHCSATDSIQTCE